MSEEKQHALLSPSAGKRWSNCPGSVWLLKDAKIVPTTSVYAEKGTKAHAWAESILKIAFDERTSKESKNIAINALVAAYKADDVILYDQVKTYVHVILRLVKALAKKSKKVVTYIEQRVHIFEHTFGTADFVAVAIDGTNRADIVIADLKSGRGKVHAEKNDQATLYSIGAVKECLPKDVVLNKIHILIVQPSNADDEKGYSAYTMSAQELFYAEARLKKAHDYAFKLYNEGAKETDFKVGEHCFFCGAKTVCPVFRKEKQKETDILLQEEDPNLPIINALPLEKVVQICKHKKQIESFLSDCEHVMLTAMASGTKIDGYKLVYGRATSKWREDAEEEIANLLVEKGCAEPYEKSLIGITKARTYFKAKDDKKLLDGYLTKGTGKLQIATEDDKREAVDPTTVKTNLLEEETNE